jgi:hypothetical protein
MSMVGGRRSMGSGSVESCLSSVVARDCAMKEAFRNRSRAFPDRGRNNTSVE